MNDLTRLTASEAVTRLSGGTLTAEGLTRACLEQAREGVVIKAWAWLDPEQVISQARAIDRGGRKGRLADARDQRDHAGHPEIGRPLFVPKGDDRIHAHRTARRNVTGAEREEEGTVFLKYFMVAVCDCVANPATGRGSRPGGRHPIHPPQPQPGAGLRHPRPGH